MWPNITVEVERRPAAWEASMISTQRFDRQLVRRDPLANAVVEHLGRRAGGRAEPAIAQVLENRPRRPCRSARTCSGPPSASRRAGGSAGPPPSPAAASARSPRARSRDGCRPACTARWRRSPPPRAPGPRILLVEQVGVGRAASLAESAEGAADHADVGEVDVAVDDEGRPLPGQLGAQLVGGEPHLLDHLGAGLGEQRGQLVLGERDRPRAPWRSPPAPGRGRGAPRAGGPSRGAG